MNISNKTLSILIGAAVLSFSLTSCKKKKSETTGWGFNDKTWGGYEEHDYKGQETGPGLKLIEGGNFTMGTTEQDVTYDNHNSERRVTVSSFYIDETEVSNHQYCEYLYYLGNVYTEFPEIYKKSLPDTNSWRRKLGYNEPMQQLYLRHPSFKYYPVVGVTWVQATNFCQWRTDRVNEMILRREQMQDKQNIMDAMSGSGSSFNTDAYLNDMYVIDNAKRSAKDYSPQAAKGQGRRLRMEDGVLLPEYRLPTEAEWEYAAKSEIGNSVYENKNTGRTYTWNGLSVRKPSPEKDRGFIQANAMRGRGDAAGIAGKMNDNGIYTTPVRSYWPNDNGLYNMSGNVSEWVMDVYRPFSWDEEEYEEINAFRGSEFMTKQVNDDGTFPDLDSLGRMKSRMETPADNPDRRNYSTGDNKAYMDEEKYENRDQAYDYGVATLVNNKARVYKGGSWNDRYYYIIPGTRRFLDQNQNEATIGFRCAMVRIGNPAGNR